MKKGKSNVEKSESRKSNGSLKRGVCLKTFRKDKKYIVSLYKYLIFGMMKATKNLSKGEKLNWKPLKLVTPVSLSALKIKGRKITARAKNNSRKVIA